MSFIPSMLESFQLQDKYSRWLDSIRGNRAVDLGKKECLRCGFCCATRPCIPTPTELLKIAEFLKIPLVGCVKKYFVVDRIGGTSAYIIFPANSAQTDITGTFVSWRRTYDTGYCIFFDEEVKECKIHSVRPKLAKISFCWINNDDEYDTVRAETLSSWENMNPEKFPELIEFTKEAKALNL